MKDVYSAMTGHTQVINLTPTARCPECDMQTSIAGEMLLGRQIPCQNCGAALEIVALSPVVVDYAFVSPLNLNQTLLLD